MRAKVRLALIAVALVALVGLGFTLGRTIMGRREAEQQPTGEGLAPEVSQRLREFRRVEVRGGEKIWELKADEAQYFEDRGEIEVVRPEVSFQGLGRDVRLTGDTGVVRLNGSDVSRIDLDGRIQLRMGDYLLETEEAAYLRDKDVIIAPKGVHLTEDSMTLYGKVLTVEVKERRIRVIGDVQTTFLPDKESRAHAKEGAARSRAPSDKPTGPAPEPRKPAPSPGSDGQA